MIWVELVCDVQRTAGGPNPFACKTRNGDNPGEYAANSAKSVHAVHRILKREAKEAGWVFVKGKGWHCPYCARKEGIDVQAAE